MTAPAQGAHQHQARPYHELEVVRIVEETDDARSVVLAIPDPLRHTFAYRAGQFLTFRVDVDGHHLVRCYSLASSPDTESEHKVTVKRVERGRVSNWFHDVLRVGDRLQVMKPAGHFCLTPRTAPIVMFAGGSGITPVISVMKTALATTERSITLVYANRDVRSVIFRDELDDLALRHPGRLQIVYRHDDHEGLLGVDDARRVAATAPDADFYVCGPSAYMDVVERALELESVPREYILIERFVSPELEALEASPPHEPGMEGARVTIFLDGQETEIVVGEGETVLEAAHRSGLDAPCACVEGYCGACMAKVEEGEIEMRCNDGGLDAEQEREGWVLTCQGEVRSKTARIAYPDPD
ncbi:MAG TPA: ferredoxin--NADP reductase [Alphaproteobacteria bacterium]|nr:ferredoxin--NADP reductase [Alphaproteobacteria bacterium]